MKNSKFKNLIIILILFYNFSLIGSGDPKDFFGTYDSIVNKIDKDKGIDDTIVALSPIHGMLLWDTGVIYNYYKLASKSNTRGKLIQTLFHAPVIKDLRVSDYFSELTPKIIGKLCGHLYNSITLKKNLWTTFNKFEQENAKYK